MIRQNKQRRKSMFTPYTFTTPNPGKNILILGAVHGNETAGTEAQLKLIEQLRNQEVKLKSGSVTFIPIVNEAANKIDERFVDVNLNRVICHHDTPSNNEERIANALLPFIEKCDILVDLHSTHCPADVPFAFLDYPTPKNLELLSLVPVQTALAGWPEIYKNQPDITNYCTEEYAHTHHKSAITIECGYHKSTDSIQIAHQSILNVLAHFGILDLPQPTKHNPRVVTLHSFVTKTAEGDFSKEYKHLDKITKDEVLAKYKNGQQLRAPFNGYIVMPNPKATLYSEWYYLGR